MGVRREANYLTHIKDLIVEKPNDGLEWLIMVKTREKYKDCDFYIAFWNVLCKEQECSKMAIECGGQASIIKETKTLRKP